jgi:hypothetical protein
MSTSLLVMVGVLVVVSAAAGAALVVRARRPKDGAAHYLRCPGCGLRLRYFARQAGHRGMCRNCKEHFLFPSAAPTTGLTSPWRQIPVVR